MGGARSAAARLRQRADCDGVFPSGAASAAARRRWCPPHSALARNPRHLRDRRRRIRAGGARGDSTAHCPGDGSVGKAARRVCPRTTVPDPLQVDAAADHARRGRAERAVGFQRQRRRHGAVRAVQFCRRDFRRDHRPYSELLLPRRSQLDVRLRDPVRAGRAAAVVRRRRPRRGVEGQRVAAGAGDARRRDGNVCRRRPRPHGHALLLRRRPGRRRW